MVGFGFVSHKKSFNDSKCCSQYLFAAFTSWCDTMSHSHEVCTPNLSPDGDLQYVISSLFGYIMNINIFNVFSQPKHVQLPWSVRSSTYWVQPHSLLSFVQSAPTSSIWFDAGFLDLVSRCWGGIGRFPWDRCTIQNVRPWTFLSANDYLHWYFRSRYGWL